MIGRGNYKFEIQQYLFLWDISMKESYHINPKILCLVLYYFDIGKVSKLRRLAFIWGKTLRIYDEIYEVLCAKICAAIRVTISTIQSSAYNEAHILTLWNDGASFLGIIAYIWEVFVFKTHYLPAEATRMLKQSYWFLAVDGHA